MSYSLILEASYLINITLILNNNFRETDTITSELNNILGAVLDK